MITFHVWTNGRVGVVEPTGALDDHAIHDLRARIHQAQQEANGPNVAVVENGIKDVSDSAVEVLLDECRRLRSLGGNLVLVSTDGRITAPGRPSNKTLYMRVFTTMEGGLRSFATAPVESVQP